MTTSNGKGATLPQQPSSEWLTLDDIALELRVPKATVYRWSAARLFRTAKFGKHVRVRREWLEAWVDAHAV